MVLEKQKASLSNPLLPQPPLMNSPKYEPPLTRRQAHAKKVMEEQKALSNTPLSQPPLTQAHASCRKILKTIKKRKDVDITEVMTTDPQVEHMAPGGTIQKKKLRYAPNHLSSYSTPRRSNRGQSGLENKSDGLQNQKSSPQPQITSRKTPLSNSQTEKTSTQTLFSNPQPKKTSTQTLLSNPHSEKSSSQTQLSNPQPQKTSSQTHSRNHQSQKTNSQAQSSNPHPQSTGHQTNSSAHLSESGGPQNEPINPQTQSNAPQTDNTGDASHGDIVEASSHEKSKCGPTMGMGLMKDIGGSSGKKLMIDVNSAIEWPRNRKESALFCSQIDVEAREVFPVPKKWKEVDLKSAAKTGFEESFSPHQNHASERGKLSTILHSQDLIDASGGKSKEVNPTLEDNVFCNAPIHEFENQPLSKWVKGMRTPSTESSLVNAVEQPMEYQEMDKGDIAVLEEISEKHKDTEVPIPTMLDKHPIVLKEPRDMPFAKNKHLWKMFENMEAFKNIPQNPHFQPLEQIKDTLREGKAIGYMVNFANMLGRISELKFGDPMSVADEFLEALAELETHGFNVRLLKDRVVEFIEAIGKKENLLRDVKVLNSRIQERHQEKGKIEEEIGGIREEIRKLEEKLSVSVSAKRKVEDEILALRERLNETDEGIQNVRRGFEGGSSVFLCG